MLMLAMDWIGSDRVGLDWVGCDFFLIELTELNANITIYYYYRYYYYCYHGCHPTMCNMSFTVDRS